MKFNIINIESLDSTNNHAQKLVSRRELVEGDVIITGHQESGKGHGSNLWESEEGKNLTFSLILEPDFISPSYQFVLTEIVSLSVRDILIKKLMPGNIKNVSVKWPNDIYIEDKKIAGILFQNYIVGNKIDYSIVGIGINLNQEVFFSDAINPVSLINYTKEEVVVSEFLDELLNMIDLRYEKLKAELNYAEIKKEYMSNLYLYNRWSIYSDKNGRFEGRIFDIDEYGRLNIDTRNNNPRLYMYKEVEFIR